MPLLRLNSVDRPLLGLSAEGCQVTLCRGELLYYHYGVDGIDDRVRVWVCVCARVVCVCV